LCTLVFLMVMNRQIGRLEMKVKIQSMRINKSSETSRGEIRKAPNGIGSAGAIRLVVGLVLDCDWFCDVSVNRFGLAQGLGSLEPRGPSKSRRSD